MENEKPWHDQDTFWQEAYPTIFTGWIRESAPLEVEKIISLLGLRVPAQVLDLCCGIGRHSIELARLGFEVTGVDRTRAFLEEAKSKASSENLNLEFVEADMRSFRRAEAFDAILNYFTSFGYFETLEEDRKVLENAYQSLKPGGRLLMDIMGKELILSNFRVKDWFEVDDLFVLEERKLSENFERLETRRIMIRDGKRSEVSFSLRLYSAMEMRLLLHQAGFKKVEFYGSLEGTPYDQKARRLVAVAEK